MRRSETVKRFALEELTSAGELRAVCCGGGGGGSSRSGNVEVSEVERGGSDALAPIEHVEGSVGVESWVREGEVEPGLEGKSGGKTVSSLSWRGTDRSVDQG